MRQVVLYIAMSLDGYIADTEGGVGWLDRLKGGQAGYAALLKETDTVVMGWNTAARRREPFDKTAKKAYNKT